MSKVTSIRCSIKYCSFKFENRQFYDSNVNLPSWKIFNISIIGICISHIAQSILHLMLLFYEDMIFLCTHSTFTSIELFHISLSIAGNFSRQRTPQMSIFHCVKFSTFQKLAISHLVFTS